MSFILGLILSLIVMSIIFGLIYRVVQRLSEAVIDCLLRNHPTRLFVDSIMHRVFTFATNFTFSTTDRFRRAQIMLYLLTQPGAEIIWR